MHASVANVVSEEMVKTVNERAQQSHDDRGLGICLRAGMREHLLSFTAEEIAASRIAVSRENRFRSEERNAKRAATQASRSSVAQPSRDFLHGVGFI